MQFQTEKKEFFDTRDRWKNTRTRLRKLHDPVYRLKTQLIELKAQKKAMVAKYELERSTYTQWVKNHVSYKTK